MSGMNPTSSTHQSHHWRIRHMKPATTVICTVGTSLFKPNLAGLKTDDPDPTRKALAAAFAAGDWAAVAAGLLKLEPTERLCGAEINSLASLVGKGMPPPTRTSSSATPTPPTAARSAASWPSLFPRSRPPADRGPADCRPSGQGPQAVSNQGPAQPGQGGLPGHPRLRGGALRDQRHRGLQGPDRGGGAHGPGPGRAGLLQA